MARRKQAAPAGRPTPGPPLVDARILVVAALLSLPAGYRATQGLLTVDEALLRYLLVAIACTSAAVVARALWSVFAGPVAKPEPRVPEGADEPMASDAATPPDRPGS